MAKNITAIILAAGEGTRMNSQQPKILHKICGRPMIDYVLKTVRFAGIGRIAVVIGHKADLVKQHLALQWKKNVVTVPQLKQRGTGDAVMQARPRVEDTAGDVVILYGDTPLITPETLKALLTEHQKSGASCTLLTAIINNPAGYGRILRNDRGEITGIVEEKDASLFQKVIEEINVGVYVYKARDLFLALERIEPLNKKNEYYLTDTIAILLKDNKKIASVQARNNDEIIGVNSRRELSQAAAIARRRFIEKIIDGGVTVVDPDNTYVEDDLTIGQDTVIYPFSYIEQNARIGRNCSIGPFARVRSGTVIGNNAIVGNFVEINRSSIGDDCRVKHHTYLGDAMVETGVNIGAGTIVANYDGKNKNVTRIKKQAFIGSGTILIAPVTIGKKAITGAGAVVTKNKDVPDNTVVAGVPARVLKKR